jgi:hypothetical protein
MANGTVVVCFSRLGAPLRVHQKRMLAADAEAIAGLKQYDFGGDYDRTKHYERPIYFIPDDTLLLDEAQSLEIRAPTDLYGGVVPYPFVKTKAIAHPLVDRNARRPDGWHFEFGERIRDAVLPGYTAFCDRDARVAAGRMLANGPIRVKEAIEAGGRGQTLVNTIAELEELLERLSPSDFATYGLVLEQNLDHVTTLSVGHITVDNLSFTYHGRQRVTQNNERRTVYGGSDLVCVRGGWDALDRASIPNAVRIGIDKARLYDEAINEFPGFMASRRNYDVGLGLDVDGQPRSGLFESSWRVGGATGAEVAALTEFMRDPSVEVVEASHLEEFGRNREPPPEAVNYIEMDDPEEGPLVRYTIVKQIQRGGRA